MQINHEHLLAIKNIKIGWLSRRVFWRQFIADVVLISLGKRIKC